MADDRPAVDPVQAIADLQRRIDDLESTTAARLGRKSTGDMEITFRTTPKEHTLFLRGQTLKRADYPNLWQWVQENDAVFENAFGPGDGATTFTLPDMQGRIVIAAGTINQGDIFQGGNGIETYYIGRTGGLTNRFITENVLPPHSHSGTTTNADQNHIHGGQTDDGGSHSGHNSGASDAAVGPGRSIAGNSQTTNGNHSHHFTTAGENRSHVHGFTTSTVGGDPDFPVSFPLDLRIPYMTVNWLIWT